MSTRAEAVTFDSRDPVSDTLGGPSVSTNPPQAGYPRTPRVQSDNSLDMNGAEIEVRARPTPFRRQPRAAARKPPWRNSGCALWSRRAAARIGNDLYWG